TFTEDLTVGSPPFRASGLRLRNHTDSADLRDLHRGVSVTEIPVPQKRYATQSTANDEAATLAALDRDGFLLCLFRFNHNGHLEKSMSDPIQQFMHDVLADCFEFAASGLTRIKIDHVQVTHCGAAPSCLLSPRHMREVGLCQLRYRTPLHRCGAL